MKMRSYEVRKLSRDLIFYPSEQLLKTEFLGVFFHGIDHRNDTLILIVQLFK
jgi:hypothetical protein